MFAAAGLLLLSFGCLLWIRFGVPFLESATAVLAVGYISVVMYQTILVFRNLLTSCSCGTQAKRNKDLLPAGLVISCVGCINFLISNLCASAWLAPYFDSLSVSTVFGALSFLVPGAVLAAFAMSGTAKRYEEKLKYQ